MSEDKTPSPHTQVDVDSYRKGVKDAVTFLHEQAALSKSSTIKTVLDSMANAIGNKFKPIPSPQTREVGND